MARIRGFTLIELSLVLVIIGLVFGSILLGRTLIEAASIRGQLQQIQQLRAAAMTFRVKYGGLPGDLAEATATGFGMASAAAAPPTNGIRNGDGRLSASMVAPDTFNCATYFYGECPLFWNDLSAAQLVAGDYLGDTPTETPGCCGTSINLAMHFPAGRIGTSWITAFSAGGKNYFALTGFIINMASGASPTWGQYSTSAAITPSQASAIDSKADDGLPKSGAVIGGSPNTGNVLATSNAVGACLTGSASARAYRLNDQAALVPGCILNFAF